MTRVLSAFLIVALLPGAAYAHAVVEPRTSTPGAYQRYVLRVPNEMDIPTTRVDIRFPADVRVVSFADVPGWLIEVIRDSTNRVVRAVWTGTLPPGRFVDLPFMAVNPERETRIIWPVVQTYGTEVVEWAGPEDSDRPASVTEIQSAEEEPLGWALPLAAIATVAAFASLLIALRARRVAA